MNLLDWFGQSTYKTARNYHCGYCGLNVAAITGYGTATRGPGGKVEPSGQYIALCPGCARPTFWDAGGKQVPGASFGDDVKHLPPDIEGLYREARNCMTVAAYTAGAMACRKILMNVAVGQGAATDLKFFQYVNHLADKGFVPPNGKAWVDHIRNKGNEAAHEIPALTAEDLTDLLTFTEMLLKFIYEFPNRVPSS